MCFVALKALSLKREADDERAISRTAERAALIEVAARSLRVVETYQAAIREQAEFTSARIKKGDEQEAYEWRQGLLAAGAGQAAGDTAKEAIQLSGGPPPKNKEVETPRGAGVTIADDVPLSLGGVEPPV
jgi:hypothetical protein